MKRMASLLLLVVLILSMHAETAVAATKFKDVSEDYWAKGEIDYLEQRGIIYGYPNGNFGINHPITRLQAAVMIIRALDLETTNRPNPNFKDIDEEHDSHAIISTITDAGIIFGIEGEFRPNDHLTRAQMAAILVRAFHLNGESNYSFRDVPQEHWASASIKTIFEHGLTAGYTDNTYRPNSAITRAHFSVFLARMLNPEFKDLQACYQPNNEKKYMVDVAVTTLWTRPNQTRALDSPVVSKPVDLNKWSAQMTFNQKLWTLGKIDTQALYGQEVKVLESKGDWYKIAVEDQYTPASNIGYPGWVPKSHITEYYPNYTDCDIAIVSAKKANLYDTTSATSKFMEVSFNTILPVIQEKDGWVQVNTPKNELKYMRKQDVKIVESYAHLIKPTQEDLVTTGKMFLNLPYMWGGTSAYGFDCSGFTHAIHKQHGILIPRDSSAQAKQGVEVSKADLQPGDLLFYAYNNGKGAIHHVSMYIGNGQMIHAADYLNPVEIISIDEEPFRSQYAGARRYLEK